MDRFSLIFSRGGVATLPTVLIISGVILSIAIAGSFLAALVSNTTANDLYSSEAFTAARAGAEDARLRIIRYKCDNGKTTHSACPAIGEVNGETINFSNGTAKVWIEGAPQSLGNDSYRIVVHSLGTVRNRNKKIEAIIITDGNNDVTTHSFREIPL